jgi:hypothetical protein
MATRSEAARSTWLVEQYRPGLDLAGLRRAASIVRRTALEMEHHGAPVHYLGTTLVPRDEALLGLIDAATEDIVRTVYARAGVPIERVSRAVFDGRRKRSGPIPRPKEAPE